MPAIETCEDLEVWNRDCPLATDAHAENYASKASSTPKNRSVS